MYKSILDLRDTQVAIKLIKDNFENKLGKKLNLTRVSAPLFVMKSSGLNDYLNGKITNIYELEEPVLPFKKEDKKIDVTPHSVIISANVTGHYQ